MSAYSDVEEAVWETLYKRRWFAKHIDQEEMDDLEEAMKNAIRNALETWVS